MTGFPRRRRMVFDLFLRDRNKVRTGSFGSFKRLRDAREAAKALTFGAALTWEVKRRLVSAEEWDRAKIWGG